MNPEERLMIEKARECVQRLIFHESGSNAELCRQAIKLLDKVLNTW